MCHQWVLRFASEGAETRASGLAWGAGETLNLALLFGKRDADSLVGFASL